MLKVLALATIAFLVNEPLRAEAEDESANRTLAARLVRAMQLDQGVLELIENMTPPGDSREIARQLMRSEKSEVPTSLQRDLAAIYERELSADELSTVVSFLESNAGQKWVSTERVIARELPVLASKDPSYLLKLAEVGCETSVLSRAWAEHKRRAEITEAGIPADFLTKIGPAIDPIKQSCTCIYRKVVDKWGAENLLNIERRPEFQQFVKDVVDSGACQPPVPKKYGG